MTYLIIPWPWPRTHLPPAAQPQTARVQAPVLRAEAKVSGLAFIGCLDHMPSTEPIAIASGRVRVGTARAGGCPGAELGWFAETVVNIGFACRLLSEDMLILEEKEIA